MCLSTLLNRSNADAREIGAGIEACYGQIRNRVSELDLGMDDQTDLMFSNHILCLLNRLRRNELIDPIDPSMFDEISDTSVCAAHDLLAAAFAAYKVPPDQTETLMVATYIEVMRQKQKEEHDG